ncbi:MAG TPA: GtrA family protein, partial [Candidatus Andersenbacteria bacterium]|nr:GtrA family protein [Candidatus Andersenbacteria bacterium]
MRIDAITLRYAITGIFVLAVDYGLLNVLLWSGMALVMATSISFLSGAIVGYVLHRMWTFKYADNSTHVIKFSQFLIVGIVGLLATDLIVYVCTTFFLLYYNVSKTIAVIVSAGWAYIANRWWVFKSVENIPRAKDIFS